MRFQLPPKPIRTEVIDLLRDFYTEEHRADLDRVVDLICNFYRVSRPYIGWRKRLTSGEDGKPLVGKTYENGVIYLVHPRDLKRRALRDPSASLTESGFVNTVLHEMGHVVLWADAERKAERWAQSMEDFAD